MAHFVGKINLSSLIGVEIAEVERGNDIQKCLLIPIKDNDLVQWGDEWQLWFRAVAYRERRSRFTHFLMKFIPRSQIKKMSAAQLETYANRAIGGMIKSGKDEGEQEQTQEIDTTDYIKNNL